MGLWNFLAKKIIGASTSSAFKMITERGNTFTTWDGNMYESDIIRACIKPYAKAISKLIPKHIRRNGEDVQVNPDPYMRFLLSDPNPYMTASSLQEKIANQLAINNNAFILIVRDENDVPLQLYPIPAIHTEAVYEGVNLYLKFTFINGKIYQFPYSDIIHLKTDFKDNDLFGEAPLNALRDVMNVIHTSDQSIISAVKNSGIIRWLLKYHTPMRPEDLKARVKEFVDNYLAITQDTFGAAGIDAKADIDRIEAKDYVPNEDMQHGAVSRVYAFFNTNEHSVTSDYNEDQWNAYFEANIEPIANQMSQEYTRKLFSRRQQGFGNSIYFDAGNLMQASLSTKLALQAMVDRGALTPNEWRATFNLSPVEGGDKPLRRLDTVAVDESNNSDTE